MRVRDAVPLTTRAADSALRSSHGPETIRHDARVNRNELGRYNVGEAVARFLSRRCMGGAIHRVRDGRDWCLLHRSVPNQYTPSRHDT